MLSLGEELLDWIDFSCPKSVSKHFSIPLPDMIEDSDQNLLRVINYPAIKDLNTHGAIRAQRCRYKFNYLLVAATARPAG